MPANASVPVRNIIYNCTFRTLDEWKNCNFHLEEKNQRTKILSRMFLVVCTCDQLMSQSVEQHIKTGNALHNTASVSAMSKTIVQLALTQQHKHSVGHQTHFMNNNISTRYIDLGFIFLSSFPQRVRIWFINSALPKFLVVLIKPLDCFRVSRTNQVLWP